MVGILCTLTRLAIGCTSKLQLNIIWRRLWVPGSNQTPRTDLKKSPHLYSFFQKQEQKEDYTKKTEDFAYWSNKVVDTIRFLDSSPLQKLSAKYSRIPLGWLKHKDCVIREEIRNNEPIIKNMLLFLDNQKRLRS